MAGFTAAASMALVSGILSSAAAAKKARNEARRVKAQNAARIKQMQSQFELSTQNLHNNNVSISQNKMKNAVLIEENKLDAQDTFAQAFAGSGVSGRTKDVMAADMQNSVAKAHNENISQASEETDRQFLGLMRQNDQMKADINNLESFDTSASEANTKMAGLSAGFSTFASSYSGDFGISSAINSFKGSGKSVSKTRDFVRRSSTSRTA